MSNAFMFEVAKVIVGLAIIGLVSRAHASEVMLCQQQELKINKKSITSKKMDGGKQVYIIDGRVATPLEATKALMADGEKK